MERIKALPNFAGSGRPASRVPCDPHPRQGELRHVLLVQYVAAVQGDQIGRFLKILGDK